MITRAQVKHIQSLDDKKYRLEHRQFIVEGEKMVEELLSSAILIHCVYALPEWIVKHETALKKFEVIPVQPFELERISSLKTPNSVLAIAQFPVLKSVQSKLALLLDGIQDPGNMGSIIRIADWYNIPTIYCSESCVDVYNAKVIQASMGSVFRIQVDRCDLEKQVRDNKDIVSYACVLEGKDVNSCERIKEGYIIIGNESKGISDSLIAMSTNTISIKRKGLAESLNAAVATGIICHCLLS